MKRPFLMGLATLVSVMFLITTARAADLGGTCCADLEGRIAELEATTARKGLKTVSMVISGQVSKSIMWVEGGDNADVGDNANSPSRLRITGSAKISPKITAGYTMEFGFADVGPTDEVVTRHSFVWVDTQVGKFALGRTSTATDEIGEISTANTNVANLPTLLYGNTIDGIRSNVARWDSPTLHGFSVAASWTDNQVWDIALRHASEIGGFRVAGGVGYSENDGAGRFSGSASVMHVATGAFVSGMAGDVDATVTQRAWHLTAGVEKNWFGPGATTFFAEYGEFNALGVVREGWGIGAVQAISAGNLDLFAAYRDLDGASIVHAGETLGP